MVDVLLAHAFFLDNDTKQREEKFRPYPPLATLYAASVLREAGFDVELFDATLRKEDGSFESLLAECRPRLLAIYEDSFNFLSKMCLAHVREASFRMMRLAADLRIPVLISSSDASDDPGIYLQNGADFVMVGEAEHTVRELVCHLLDQRHTDARAIPGLVYCDRTNGGGLARTAPRPVEKKPDSFPMPARDLLDIESYRTAWLRCHDFFSMNMVTTRGCPYKCTWCAKPIWGKSYAVRSPHKVAEEFEHVKTTYRPDHIWFSDDIFGLKSGWVESFAGELHRRDAHIPFMIQTRADLLNREVVMGLSRAGCAEVWLGAESGSQKILDAMKKGITVRQVHEARDLLCEYGIKTGFFIQLGYLAETLEDIQSTVTMVRTALPDDIGVSVSYPLPGTEFHDVVKHELREKRNWGESNDLDPLVNSRYTSAYYRRIGNFLHRDLEARTAAPGVAAGVLSSLDREWEMIVRDADKYTNEIPTSA